MMKPLTLTLLLSVFAALLLHGQDTIPIDKTYLKEIARIGKSKIIQSAFEAIEDVERIMQHPQTMIASDGRPVAPGMGHPHPRWYGTFPRVLGHYVREKKIIPLAAVIHKMSGMPAGRLGLTDRERIAEGMIADIVIFDPEKVIDKATFENPHQYPPGIDHVLVNSNLAVDAGKFTDQRGGKVLRRE